ncbi:hypothetical protein [Mesorhizobium sp. SP-1A]|uniref:hypothetical protein n=1 Tax=Mesorhizobium sp. SP-1A TaxID=3077840 RepID=UPI0028F70959|nr:hypothetical protein [Mesorhizobium sp. SP-1A]
MGISYLSDAITGRCLSEDEEAVAVVIKPTTGGYPDAVATVARPALYSQDRFTAVSLLLRGHAGEYGDFVPHEGQMTLEMLLGAFKKDNWESFASEAFEYVHGGKGIALPTIKFNKDAPDEMAYLGVFVIAESTYKNIVSKNFGSTTDDEIDTVLEMLVDAKLRFKAGDDKFYNAATFSGFHEDKYPFLDGREVVVPELFRTKESGRGWCELSYEQKLAIDKAAAIVRADLTDPEADEKFREMLVALADFRHFMGGLYVHDLVLSPSSNGGQGRNPVTTASFQAANLVSTLDFINNNERFGPDYKVEPAKGFDEIRAKLEAAIAAIDEYEAKFRSHKNYGM